MDTMARPNKRPRLFSTTEPETESNNLDLQEARAQNDLRLKSIFEGIFEKYSRDYTDVGDEIDLETGEIVVNNGHIQEMEGENDTGEKQGWLFEKDLSTSAAQQIFDATAEDAAHDSWTETGGDDSVNEILPHPLPKVIQPQLGLGLDRLCEEGEDEAAIADSDADDDRSSVDSLLDIALTVQNDTDGLRRERLADKNRTIANKANSATGTPAPSQFPHEVRLGEPKESIWRVPEISGKFLTPTPNRSRPKTVLKAIRSASPAGAGSLWALQGTTRKSADSTKKKSERKPGVGQKKRKRHSSPVVVDWSFAETPDGSESDDPLQENYQPSPTPKKAIEIRGKKTGPGTPSRTKDESEDRKHVSPQNDASHGPTDIQHRATGSQPINDNEIHGVPTIDLLNPVTKLDENSAELKDSTPTRRKRTMMTPDEARLIICMRQVQGKKWKEIHHHFSQRKLVDLSQWYHIHWKDRRVNPPRSSNPWSEVELEKLKGLKDKHGVTWSDMRAMFPGRSHAEIEFELLRLWAGDHVWNCGRSTKSRRLLKKLRQ